MNNAVEEATATKKKVAKYVSVEGKEDYIFSVENNGEETCLINPKSMVKLKVRSEISVIRWDYLTTFKPPEHLSIEVGHTYFEKVDIPFGSIEFQFVAQKFSSTFGGRLPAGAQA